MTPAKLDEIRAAQAWAAGLPLVLGDELEMWVWVEGGIGVAGFGATPVEARRMAVNDSIHAWLDDPDAMGSSSLFSFLQGTIAEGRAVLMRGSMGALLTCAAERPAAMQLAMMEFLAARRAVDPKAA
jgi:hypothetical protein